MADWYNEFVRGSGTNDEVLQTLKIWQGCLVENLNKHGVTLKDGVVYDENDKMWYAERYQVEYWRNMPLCVRHMHYRNCRDSCPVIKLYGKRCHFANIDYNDKDSPSTIFDRDNDPKPMIRVLDNIIKCRDSEEGQKLFKHDTYNLRGVTWKRATSKVEDSISKIDSKETLSI